MECGVGRATEHFARWSPCCAMRRADHGCMDSGSTSLIPHPASAGTRSAGWCSWLLLICIAVFAGCDSRAAVEEHTKETIRLLAEAKQRADALGSEPKDIPELQR